MWINISELKFQQDCCLLVAFIVDETQVKALIGSLLYHI